MQGTPGETPSGKSKFVVPRRKTIALASQQLLEIAPVSPEQPLPHVARALIPGVNLAQWLETERSTLDETLNKCGAVLFRGFTVSSPREFEELVSIACGPALEYRERSTPRRQLDAGQRVYTSTEYPAAESIHLHNENSYQQTFPLRIAFYCHQPAASGGATPLADSRRVYARIDPAIVRKFDELGIRYTRNFGGGLGLTWQEAWQTSDRDEVEQYCHEHQLQLEWREGDRLRICTLLPASIRHPRTGEPVWFNHGIFFHPSLLPRGVRETLLQTVSPEDLPNNACYGDGTPFEPDVVEHIYAAYVAELRRFEWQASDLLLVDNVLTAHGRDPFTGPREIWAAMAIPTTRAASAT